MNQSFFYQKNMCFYARVLNEYLKGLLSKASSKVICKKSKMNTTEKYIKMSPTTHTTSILK